jgi:hypothetical protein
MKTKVFGPPRLALWALLVWCAPQAMAQFTANTKLGSGATGTIVTNAAGSYSVLAGGQDIFGAGDHFTFHSLRSPGPGSIPRSQCSFDSRRPDGSAEFYYE